LRKVGAALHFLSSHNDSFIIAITPGSDYCSTDDGESWNVSTGLPLTILSPGELQSFISKELTIGGVELAFGSGDSINYRSTDQGRSWSSANLGFNDVIDYSGILFAASYGVLQSTDSGSNWNYVSRSTFDVNALTVIGSKIIAGSGEGGGIFVTTDDGNNWDQSGLSNATVNSLLFTSSYLFAGTDGGSADTAGGVFRSTDTGTTWTRMVNGIPNVNALASSESNLFAGTDSGIYISRDSGMNWSIIFSHVHVNALSAQGSKVFAGTSANGLITSTNNGTSWSANNGTLPITDVQSLAVKGGILFAGTNGNGLFLSTDTGQSWTDVSSGLPASSVLSLEENSQQFFAGTGGNGIFRTDDSGKTWKQVDSGLVNLNVTSLGIRNGNLFAGTIGGGVWERPLSQMLFIEPASVAQTLSSESQIHTYPNPLSQSTEITFTLPEASEVTLTITDAAGRETPLLRSAWFPAGQHEIAWDASNYPSGVYLCRLSSGGESVMERVVVLK
jgi:photosystem II stability/assembly factor-like uncharacterized protein